MKVRRVTVLYGIAQLHVGGAERQLYELVRAIDQSRFRLLVFVLSRGGVYSGLIHELGVPLFTFARRHALDPIPVVEVADLLRSEGVDILHTFGFYAGLYGRMAAGLFRPNAVVSSERAALACRTADRPMYSLVERMLGGVTDAYVANAEAVKSYAVMEKGLDPERIHVVYNGVDPSRFEAVCPRRVVKLRQSMGIRDGDKTVGIVARLIPLKDHRTFLKAASLVMERGVDARFVIVGDGPLRVELEDMARAQGIDGRVVFAGQRSEDELTHVLGGLDLMVLCSTTEGCSNAILEAMAMGRPVIATRVGGNPELVLDGRSGMVVPPQEPTALADAICGLLQDDEMRRSMGDAGRRRALAEFSVRSMVDNTVDVYRRLLVGADV